MHRQRDERSTGQFGGVERTKEKDGGNAPFLKNICCWTERKGKRRRRVRNLVDEERDGGELCGILYIVHKKRLSRDSMFLQG